MAGAWYFGRARWRRSWGRLLFLGIVGGLIGGAILGTLAGARRTASAYDRLLRASGGPHEVLFVTAEADAVQDWLAQTPLVDRFAPAAGMIGRQAPQQDWYSLDAPEASETFGTPVIERGRAPDPERPDEVFITLRTARNAGLELGDEVAFQAYSSSQTADLVSNPWTPPDGQHINVQVVGIARDPSDAQLSQSVKLMFGTPAFAREYASSTTFTLMAVWLKGGPASEPAFERDLATFARTLRPGTVPFNALPSRADADAADQASRAVVTGLLIFAIVAGLAGLVTIVQTVRRGLASSDDEGIVLIALGARRSDRALGQIVASLPFLAVAVVTAVVGAYAVSPVFPLGSTRALEPAPGLRADWLLLLAGGAAWLLVLGALTVLVAWIDSARREHHPRRSKRTRVGDVTAAAGALPVAVGARFALRPGTHRSALHRSALVGVIVAVVGGVGSLVFVKSAGDFTDTPSRFGLDFDLSLELPTDGADPVLRHLAANDDLVAVAESRNGTVDVNGRIVDAYSVDALKGDIAPSLRTGSLPTHSDEIALGPKLLHDLHARVGAAVELSTDTGPRRLKVVGTVLSPTSESTGFNEQIVLTRGALDAYATPPYVEALVRVRPGADLDAVIAELDQQYPYALSGESRVHAPGPVRNLEQIANLPLALALFFALLGAAAVAQSIVMTASERRRDIAVLRSLGFTRRQVTNVMLGAAGSVTVMALAIGIPAGYVAGRFGWSQVAANMFVDSAASVPVAAIALSAAGLIAFALAISTIPASFAARNTVSRTLRAE